MGKFTDALKKAAERQIERAEKREEFKPYVVRAATESGVDPHVVAYFDPASPIAEQYRILRTNLQAMSDKKTPSKVVTITSSIHGEGKTITSINLGVTFAHDLGKNSILLVDADMRKGTMSRTLGLEASKGLSDLLMNGMAVEETLLRVSGIENLHVLPAGSRPHNPAELLGSAKLKSIISDLRKNYDYVIFDAPPVIPVTDAGVLAVQTDGVIMVAQAGRTQRGVIIHAQDRLNTIKARVLGYVLTNIEYHIPEYIYRYL